MPGHAPLRIQPLAAELLPAAGALLAARHRRDRVALPALPADQADPDVAAAAVAAAMGRPFASAAAAIRDDRLVGYMVADLALDEIWGRAAWVRLPGWAVAEPLDLLGDLYAALASELVRRGVFTHFVLVPADDRAALDGWFRLGFGVEQIHALADLDAVEPGAGHMSGLEIRRAGPDDADTLAELSSLIWRHQVGAPVWAVALPERAADLALAYAAMAEDAEATIWLALVEGAAVGFQAYFPAEPAADDLLTPAASVELSVAGTQPAARGLGVGAALTSHGLAHARASGARFCLADWRSTNLAAARFWPRRGFRPAAYRLARRVDQRIAWANGGELP